MNTAAFRNSKPQRKYRERGQLIHRQHFGILEKHQDYKKRATNYQRKRDQLKNLQLKAALKNKDEFNFKMLKGKLKDGQHVQANDDESEPEFLLSQIKTQNQNLLKASIRQKEKLGERLKQDLSLIQFYQPQHKFFAESESQIKEIKSQIEEITPEAVAQVKSSSAQKINKLAETLYEKERLSRFLVAVTKSKVKQQGKPHLKKKIKKNPLKGLHERLK